MDKEQKTIHYASREQKPDANKKSEIYDRGQAGFLVYANGMEKSKGDKAKVLEFVKPGVIAEMGCGSGAVLELLTEMFQDSKVYGVDVSDTLLSISGAKEYASQPSLIKADIKTKIFEPSTLDTILYCSALHEVYSYSGYDKDAITQALKEAYDALKPGGRLIIRDGLKPRNEILYMAILNSETHGKFQRFAREFGPYQIPFSESKGLIKVRSQDALEFLSKYIYDKNWKIEVKEQFGIFTLEEYAKQIEVLGFRTIHTESYLIDWLKKTHYEKDVFLLRRNKLTNQLEPSDYPDSTMILVAEKTIDNHGDQS